MQRRTVLMAINSIAIASLAGCQTKNQPTNSSSSERTKYRLASLSVLNVDTTAHSVQLVVLKEGDIVYWGTIDLESNSEWAATSEEFNVPEDNTEPASWEIFVKLEDQSESKVFRSTEMVGTDGCIAPIVTVHEGGDLGLSMDFSGDGCPETSTEESNDE